MTGKILTIANHKGGIGKTTLAYTLGLALAWRGYKVVLVDADAQATLTHGALGMKPEAGFYDLIVRDSTEIKNVIRQIPKEKYTIGGQPPQGWALLLPGNNETRHIANSVSSPTIVRDKFEPLLKVVDLIIFDPSPTESMLHPLTYVASDLILHPTLCEDWSIDSLAKTMRYVQASQGYRGGMGLEPIRTVGIIPTMYQSRTIVHTELLAQLQSDYEALVWKPVNQRIIWAEAAYSKLPIMAYQPNSAAADDAWSFVDQFEAAAMGVHDGA